MSTKKDMARIQIDLPIKDNFLEILEELADADGRKRKDYLERLVVQHVKKVSGWGKKLNNSVK